MMKLWNNRPIEVRNLFNPAFCALNLYFAIKKYQEVNAHGMPFSLILLVLPLSFHESTSSYLLLNSRTYFLKNIANNPLIISGLNKRVADLNLFTIEAIDFLLQINAVKIEDTGRLRINKIKMKKINVLSDDSQDKIKVSSYIGKQFAKVNDRSTIYISLGIKP